MTRAVRQTAFYVVVVAILVPILFPYFWMLLSSLKTPLQNLQSPFAVFFTPTLDNYLHIVQRERIPEAVWESFVVGTLATGLGLALGLPCAFGIARFRVRGAAVAVLTARMLPGIALLVPWY